MTASMFRACDSSCPSSPRNASCHHTGRLLHVFATHAPPHLLATALHGSPADIFFDAARRHRRSALRVVPCPSPRGERSGTLSQTAVRRSVPRQQCMTRMYATHTAPLSPPDARTAVANTRRNTTMRAPETPATRQPPRPLALTRPLVPSRAPVTHPRSVVILLVASLLSSTLVRQSDAIPFAHDIGPRLRRAWRRAHESSPMRLHRLNALRRTPAVAPEHRASPAAPCHKWCGELPCPRRTLAARATAAGRCAGDAGGPSTTAHATHCL